MSDQSQQDHINTWENNHYQQGPVNTWQNNHYQPEPVNTVENNQPQPEQVTTLENERFYEQPLETPVAVAEPVQDAGSPEGKTEPWKQPSAPVSTFTPIQPSTTAPAPVAQEVVNAPSLEMLFGSEETQHFRDRWNEVQAKFVDEPRSSVQEADALVTELMTQFSQMLATERRTLEGQWYEGEVSTENLRQILKALPYVFQPTIEIRLTIRSPGRVRVTPDPTFFNSYALATGDLLSPAAAQQPLFICPPSRSGESAGSGKENSTAGSHPPRAGRLMGKPAWYPPVPLR